MKKLVMFMCMVTIISCCLSAYALDNEGEFDGCFWKVEKGILTFDGTGVIPVLLHPYDDPDEEMKFTKKIKQIIIGSEISGVEYWNAFDMYTSVTKVVYGIDYLDCMFVLADKIKEVVYTGEYPYVLAHNFCYSRLDKITFENPNNDYIRDGNILYNKDRTEIVYYFGSKSENMIIPEGVKIIRSGAFANSKIKSVVFPDTLEKIEYCAFIRCKNLNSVTIPASCIQIGPTAFSGCDKLQKIEFLGDKVQLTALYGRETDIELAEMGENFAWNRALKEITLPACDIIPNHCLSGCPNLKKVVISEGIKQIKENAFEDCDKLEVVVLPDDIEFDRGTFARLKKVTIQCHEGSRAEELAKKYKLKYKIIE